MKDHLDQVVEHNIAGIWEGAKALGLFLTIVVAGLVVIGGIIALCKYFF